MIRYLKNHPMLRMEIWEKMQDEDAGISRIIGEMKEFVFYCTQPNLGLGLYITVENGVVTEIVTAS